MYTTRRQHTDKATNTESFVRPPCQSGRSAAFSVRLETSLYCWRVSYKIRFTRRTCKRTAKLSNSKQNSVIFFCMQSLLPTASVNQFLLQLNDYNNTLRKRQTIVILLPSLKCILRSSTMPNILIVTTDPRGYLQDLRPRRGEKL